VSGLKLLEIEMTSWKVFMYDRTHELNSRTSECKDKPRRYKLYKALSTARFHLIRNCSLRQTKGRECEGYLEEVFVILSVAMQLQFRLKEL